MRARLARSVAATRTASGNASLRRLQVGWAASTTGEQLALVAVAVYAYRAGGAAAVGLVGVVQMVPSALLGPVLALLGDRFRREVVVVVSDLLRSAVVAGTAVAVASGAPVWTVAALAAALTLANGAYYPAQTALVPLLARSTSEVTAAAAVSSLLRNFASLAAPAVAGLLLLVAPEALLLATAALCFALAATVVHRLPPTDAVRAAPAMSSAGRALADGLRAASRDRGTALVLAVFLAHSTARGAVGVLVVVVPIELLALGSSGVGFVSALLGLGAFLGAVGATSLAGRRRLAGPLGLGLLLTGAPLVAAAVLSAAEVVLAAVAVVGGGLALVSVSGTTLLVRAVRDDVLARVLGVLGTVRAAGMALGAGLTPVLLELLGLRWTLATTGLGLVCVLAAARPGLRSLDRASSVPERELALLQGTPVFAPLPPVALERLASRLEPQAAAVGTAVVREGDEADVVFLVARGELVVEASEAGGAVDRIGQGEVFGEMALLHGARRNATVRAAVPCELYRLTQEEFLAAVTGSPVSSVRASELVAARLAHRREVADRIGGPRQGPAGGAG